jgi:protein-S-isoprenylcysteine O-methyltransferase Ste14
VFDSVFKIVFLVGFVLGCVIRGIYTIPHRRSKPTEVRWSTLEAILIVLSSLGLMVAPLVYIFAPWLDFADYQFPATAGWIGAGIFVVALALLWRSHVDLGRNWSGLVAIKDGHTLVTEGVFRHIRHPMYAAHFAWGIAQLLLLHNWIAGPAFLVAFIPMYLVRVPREEQLLLDHFGEEYQAYMKRTGRMIPRISR